MCVLSVNKMLVSFVVVHIHLFVIIIIKFFYLILILVNPTYTSIAQNYFSRALYPSVQI